MNLFKLSTWNINSIRFRINTVKSFLEIYQPDILCLQEIKCQNNQFPEQIFKKMGYRHFAIHGQKAYNGVAIVSKHPLFKIESTNYCNMNDSRHLECQLNIGLTKLRIHNFYVPAGGEDPDIEKNPKFDYKLKFLEEMKSLSHDDDGVPSILVGDLNIAPLETDVWSHKQLLTVVSHTQVETNMLADIQVQGGWIDLIRQRIPPEEKLFTWWSYRSYNWNKTNKGRRLDHIWSSESLAKKLDDLIVFRDARGWEQPSDHVPVIALFKI
ncbi:exodeoxyribonuclease III [Candidatus Endowatersipora endosymbiont of Watersipora subatra]|uniref:exodeoxyribonuclease III n=1 Tax=Candidatus Endowatersipora endosymbiont of Watersipora subatra TaxID=3077946 RepID=UPI00312CB4C0